MNITIDFSSSSVNAVLRHVYTATASATAVLTIVGLSQGDATTIGEAVHKIGDGIASIIAGVTMLVPIVTALFAARSASKPSQVAAVASMSSADQTAALNKISDVAKVQIAEAVPGVATVVVKDTAGNGLAKLAASDAHPNVVTETQNETDAKNGTKP